MCSRLTLLVSLALLVTVAAITVACGGSNNNQLNTGGTAAVTTSFSDPPTCASPSGPYSHVWITVSDVQIHTSSSASATDPGWVDLTPGLKSAPKQIDLFQLGGTGCILAQLGSPTNIPAGTYQQIRVYLAPNNTNVPANACGSAGANCVVVNGSTSMLNLSSETQTGIKIPAGQIAGGSFTVAAGQNKSLVIDFDACASILMQGNGSYRLKPVLHAGEVALASNAITGQLVDAVTKAPLSSVKEIVALEQKDANGVDRVIMQVTPDATGAFNLCPVPAGTYDLVAVAIVTSGANASTAYATTITTGVQPGFAVGQIQMFAQPGTGTTTQQATIGGLITTVNSSNAGTATDVTVSALQQIASASTTFTIPLAQQQSSSINLTTATGGTCPTNTACVNYELGVPAVLPYIGAYAPTGATYTQVTGTTVPYTVDVFGFVMNSAATPSCSPSEVQVSTDSTNQPLVVTAGQTTTAATAALTGCQ